MISFKCPSCHKQHTARDEKAGRRGFCKCGAVMIVPGAGSGEVAPKLIGRLDLDSAERNKRRVAIGGTCVGAAIVAALVYSLFFHNAWERENAERLLSMKGEADALVRAKEYEKAKAKYDKLFRLLGDRVVTGDDLKGAIESARLASAENARRVDHIISAQAEAEQRNAARGTVGESEIDRQRRLGFVREIESGRVRSYEELERTVREHSSPEDVERMNGELERQQSRFDRAVPDPDNPGAWIWPKN